MKVSLGSLLSLLVLALLLPLLTHPPTLGARTPQSMAPGANFNCSSEDGRRKVCPANTNGGVQLVYQRSGSPCIFDQTWGFNRQGVWVDRGCRADFAVGFTGGSGNPSWGGWGDRYNVYCASDDGRRNRCPVDTRGGVRLVRQRSGSPCTFGNTWGYDRDGVWVDRGCRADFEIGQSGWKPSQANVISCASDNMQRKFCDAQTRGSVRIIRQRSEADCIYGRTWGYDQRGVWVDRGCRADFEIGGDRR
jgi:Protein of unknown function (DUF3011)